MLASVLAQTTTLDTPMSQWVTTGGLIVAYAVSELWKLRGQKKHAESTKQERNTDMDVRMNNLRQVITLNHENLKGDVQIVSTEVRDLKAYVIGPDGQNGLRGDFKELKGKVEGLLDRETPTRRRGRSTR